MVGFLPHIYRPCIPIIVVRRHVLAVFDVPIKTTRTCWWMNGYTFAVLAHVARRTVTIPLTFPYRWGYGCGTLTVPTDLTRRTVGGGLATLGGRRGGLLTEKKVEEEPDADPKYKDPDGDRSNYNRFHLL